MGLDISKSRLKDLGEPFAHKNTKIKGLQALRGPYKRDQFIIIDDSFEEEEDCKSPIQFRYNTNEDDDWRWEWTVHPDQSIWYSVKGEFYEIPKTKLDRYPYNKIVDKSKMRRVELPVIRKQSSIDDDIDPYSEDPENDEIKDEEQETENNNNTDIKPEHKPSSPMDSNHSSQYSFDPKIPRFHIPLPPKYDVIRRILAEKDPIPPHILNEHQILKQDAYDQVLDSGLINSATLKCKFASKDLGSGSGLAAQLKKHPILMFFENEPTKSDDVVWVLHLIKDTRINQAAVEFDCKCWKKFKPGNGWTVHDDTVELKDISLSDIAKWSVQYEKKNPDYTELYNNCRKFMLELSQYINANWNEILLAEKIWYSVPTDDTGNPAGSTSMFGE